MILEKKRLKISIILAFYDGDFKYLKDILSEIESKVKIDHEVVLLDNREKNKELIVGHYDKLLVNGYNGYNYSRKKAVNLATGEYIWFVDVDDSIYEIDETFEEFLNKDYDAISFKFNDEGNLFSHCNNRGFFSFTEDCMLWNRWLKKECCLKAFKDLADIPLCFADDMILCYALNNFCKNNISVDKYIYFYRDLRSSLYNSKSLSDEIIDNFFVGIGHYKEEVKKTLYTTDKILASAVILAEKAANKKRAFKIILKEFNNKEDIKFLFPKLIKNGFSIGELSKTFAERTNLS